MLKKSKKVFAGLLCLIMMMTLIPGNFVFGEESAPDNDYLGVARKSQYVLYASSKENGIQLNGKNYVINGNIHSNSDVAAYLDKLDVRGKLETTGKVINYNNGVTQYIKKENAPERVLIDPSKYIVDSLGANAKVYDNWTSLSDSTLENTEPIQAKSGLQFSASIIKLKNTIMSNGSMLVNASETFVSPENEEVLLYSANGDIQVSAQNVEINGIIYAPNGTVQIGGTNVKINGMIIAKKIQIGANNKLIINQNLNLKNAEAFKYYNDELQIYSEAEYDDTTETINLNWESTFDEGKYEIYSSTDNKNFTLLDTVTDANTYAYATNGSTNDIYFKVKQILNNGFTKESNTVKMVYDVYKCQYVFEDTDTDNEKLTDTYEFFLETDKNNVDTDGDELSDYFEVFLTGTDPLYKDSDEDGVLDCDEDTDGDTLSNKYEMKLGTHPQKVDTDDDTLADNYEVAGIKIKGDDVNTYKTLPTNADTDDDTLSDSDEALLGLNPLSKDSDGDGIKDSEEKIPNQTISGDPKYPNGAVTKVSVVMDATGYVPTTTKITSVKDSQVYCANAVGVLGEPFNIETTSTFDTATLSFKVDKLKLGDSEFNNLCISWYNPENGKFVFLETNHNNDGTLSAETKHFSTYVVTDKVKLKNALSRELYSAGAQQIKHKYKYNTILAVDTSQYLDGLDSVECNNNSPSNPHLNQSYTYSCKRIDLIEKYLEKASQGEPEGEYVSVALFKNKVLQSSSFKHNYEYKTNSIVDNKYYWGRYDGQDDISQYGTVDYNKVLRELINNLDLASKTRAEDEPIDNTDTQIQVVSTINLVTGHNRDKLFEDDNGNNTTPYISQEIIQLAKDKKVTINLYWIENDESFLPSSKFLNLSNLVNQTNGDVISYKDESALTFKNYVNFGYHSEINWDLDSDHDGLPDVVEIYGLIPGDGKIYKTDKDNPDTDGDGIPDGKEIIFRKIYRDGTTQYSEAELARHIYKDKNGLEFRCDLIYMSNPMLIDSDGDDIPDNKDVNNYTVNTLEKMFELSKDNKPENPIYIKIDKNTVHIYARIHIYLYPNLPKFGNSTVADIVEKSIKKYWEITFAGSRDDFVPELKGKTVVHLDVKCSSVADKEYAGELYLPIIITPDFGTCHYSFPSGWSVKNKNTSITLYNAKIQDNELTTANYLDYESKAAHEFGHALGLNDFYINYYDKKYSNSDYDIVCKNESQELFIGDMMYKDDTVMPNDIEMMLYAFSENRMQNFYNKGNEKQSKAIRSKWFVIHSITGEKVYEN